MAVQDGELRSDQAAPMTKLGYSHFVGPLVDERRLVVLMDEIQELLEVLRRLVLQDMDRIL